MKMQWLKEFGLLVRFYKLRMSLAFSIIALGFISLVIFLVLKSTVSEHLQSVFKEMSQGSFMAHIVSKDVQTRKTLQQYFRYPKIQASLDKLNGINNLIHVMPYQLFYEKIFWQSTFVDAELVLIHPELLNVSNTPVETGRLLQPFDQNSKAVIIGSKVAETFKAKGVEPLNQVISIGGSYYMVVGVLEKLNTNPLLDFDINRSIFIHFSMQSVMGKGAFQTFYVDSALSLNDSREYFRRALQESFGLSNVFIKDAELYMHSMMRHIHLTLNIVKWTAICNLTLGFIVLMGILALLIQERIPEMGLRICLGALKKHLILMFTKEAMTLCLIGGMVGLVCGIPLSCIITNKLNLMLSIKLSTLFWILPIALICGLVTSVIPAVMAVKKHPIKLIGY